VTNQAKFLNQLFGDNRAEWPSEYFKQLFVEPTYIAKLESMRPCVLIGGRGTGKSTSLHSLRYDSTLERLNSNGFDLSDQTYFGVLVRMNKNRVKVFDGGGLTKNHWEKLFAHYFNLLVCYELTKLTKWLVEKTGRELSEESIRAVAIDLGIETVQSLDNLERSIKTAISKLQLYVNNPSSELTILLSIAESPIRTFSEVLDTDGLLDGRILFCCVDEYENLYDYQQAVLNTYIKHAEPPISYKIGVRKNGLRNRQTLDGQDLLKVPDDYAEIEIVDEGFDYFAKAVGELRLECASQQGVNVKLKLSDFLHDLSFKEEAVLLGAERIAKQVLADVAKDSKAFTFVCDKPPHELYFLKYWSEVSGKSISDLADDWRCNQAVWTNRLGNHGYASLFWLSRGNKGQRIKKYYCGEKTLITLAGGNIRYFLELIDTAIKFELKEQLDFPSNSIISLSPKSQTEALKEVGQRRLNQLEGLADNGVELKRLVLAVGKVFFEYARTPEGRAPEINSFLVKGDEDKVSRVTALLLEGVGHLAFEAEPATKATSINEMRDNEYRLHKIFSGFFEMSYRNKRRTTFNAKDLLDVLGSTPSKAIASMMTPSNQQLDNQLSLVEDSGATTLDALPEQLAFFSSFYSDEDKQ
tara:strand:- start:2035 stop:3951 length:1917 start_codon:yes stop_codon:yes gene_type:complete